MQRFILNGEEVASLRKLTAEIASTYDSAEAPGFLLEAALWAQEMPRRLRAALHTFRLTEPDSALLLISGYPVDDEKIGRTPEHWHRTPGVRPSSLEEEILFVLTSSLLG